MDLKFRPATKLDHAFIFSSWLKSYRGSSITRMIISSLYYDNQSKIINELLQNCSIDLVVDPEDVSVIWGFIVFEIDICHYIYVKHSLRGFGIGRALWRQAEGPIKVTHISPAAEAYLQRNSDAFCYDPYLLRERKQHS